jgi:hypothetical protein
LLLLLTVIDRSINKDYCFLANNLKVIMRMVQAAETASTDYNEALLKLLQKQENCLVKKQQKGNCHERKSLCGN